MAHYPEVWKTINGFPNYEISSYGRVRSVARTVEHGYDYIAKSLKADMFLKRTLASGQFRVALYCGKGAKASINHCHYSVGSLVLMHFVCAPPFAGQGNSIAWTIDRDLENVMLHNLVWVPRGFMLGVNRGYRTKDKLEDLIREYGGAPRAELLSMEGK